MIGAHVENLDVLPTGSQVAVAVRIRPVGGLTTAVHGVPGPVLVTVVEPRNVRPSPPFAGGTSHARLENSSIVTTVPAGAVTVPLAFVCVGDAAGDAVAEVIVGGVAPALAPPPRLIPRPFVVGGPLSWIELRLTRLPVCGLPPCCR